jgi:hypothetical protein
MIYALDVADMQQISGGCECVCYTDPTGYYDDNLGRIVVTNNYGGSPIHTGLQPTNNDKAGCFPICQQLGYRQFDCL